VVDIRELARLSGVSIATVSRALNGRENVRPETRDRIQHLARQLRYSANAAGRALARQRSDLIGVIWETRYATPGRRHAFLGELLVALKDALDAAGYQVLLISPADPLPSDGDDYLGAVRKYNLDGVVLMGVDEHAPAIEALVDSNIACVALDLQVTGRRSTYITSDNRAGAAAAVRHLYNLGHRAIATITGPHNLLPATERAAGYREELARLGLGYRPEYVVEGDFFSEGGYADMRRLLDLADPPTAVFAAGDAMALGAIRAAVVGGVSVPTDVAVVGFDDIEAAALVYPALTTVAQNADRFGAAAADLLLRLIGDPDGPAVDDVDLSPCIVPTHLVVRGSCGAGARVGELPGEGVEQTD
jgi:LacI family transcriptional regulator